MNIFTYVPKVLGIVVIIVAMGNGKASGNVAKHDNTVMKTARQTQAENSRNASVAGKSGEYISIDNVTSRAEYVVISKNPEFYSYTFSTITILLSVMTIIIGVGLGVGLTIVLKVNKERKALEGMRESIETETTKIKARMQSDYEKLIDAMNKTAFGLAGLHNAKGEIERMLKEDVEKSKVFKEIQKTLPFPDEECIRIYGRVLEKYETDLDMVMLVRNGLMQFKR